MFELHSEISPEEIKYILENPWEKSRAEWRLANESQRQETLEFISNRLQLTKTNGFSKLWKTPDDRSIAILGAFKTSDTKYETFLICSDLMQENSINVSFDMRKILKELSIRYKGCTCGQYATAENKNQISWFRFLGFKYKPEGNRGSMLYYEYESSLK